MDQIQADKLKLLGMALGMMIVGLSALFIVAMLELSEADHLVCSKRQSTLEQPMRSTIKIQTFLSRFERKVPQCICLLGPACPDGVSVVRMTHKRSGEVLVFMIDVPQLSNAYYAADLLAQVRAHYSLE